MIQRLANILLFTVIFLLIANLISPKPPVAETLPAGSIILKSQSTNYTVPHLPIVDIISSMSGRILLDPCIDLAIIRGGVDVTKLDDFPQSFCTQSIEVPPNEKVTIDLSAIQSLFHTPGEVYFKVIAPDKRESIIAITLEEKGFFNAFFSHLFYEPVYNLFVAILVFVTANEFLWAIVIITIIVRIILLYPQHKMMVNARRMQELQPRIKELQLRHKNDQAALGQAIFSLYREEKVNPLSSITPLLIQMPILIVLYWIVSNVRDISNVYYLYPWFESFNPGTIDIMARGIGLENGVPEIVAISLNSAGGLNGILLALIVGGMQWLQIKLSFAGQPQPEKTQIEKTEEANPFTIDPEFMKAFMLWGMPLILTISTYFFPYGVGIYWGIGTLFMIVQQYIVNLLFKKKTEDVIILDGHGEKM